MTITDATLGVILGNRAVVEVAGLPKLMRYICKNGFEHHVAMTGAHVAGVVQAAFESSLG